MSVIKKALRTLLATVLILSLTLLSACSGFNITADDFLSPPRANGEMYAVEQTLKDNVKTAYTLKYPTAGEYRSAYILADLTGSGTENFAMAFYSTINEENATFMNLKLMQKVGEEWISVSDIIVNAVGVEKVEIYDLNGDGVKEITVGWNVYGGMDKKVTAYALSGLKLEPLMQESYSSFMCCDMVGDGRKELFMIYHDTVSATALAKYYSFGADKVNQSDSCPIDGTVVSYNEPVFGSMPNGTSAIYVDAVKGAGMQTEIIYCNKGKLMASFYNSAATENYISPTYRNSTVESLDINGDGYLDIPIINPVNTFGIEMDTTTLNPITSWYTYNGSNFNLTMQAIMNYTDGYYIEFPQKWQNCTTISTEIENRVRTVFLWDTVAGVIKSELVRIRAVSEVNWDKPDNGFNEFKEITRHKGVVYAAMFSSYEGAEKITLAELKEMLHII